jgi:rare lipoprotein A
MVKLKDPLHIFCYLIIMLLSACSNDYGRYQQKHDSIPTRLPSADELHNATPRAETYSRGGNKNYQVFGKHYQVLESAENFNQTGIASWYGSKFHGHLTSNGEIYDMYAMSAAHKSLPLPSYLKVVNNNNGRSVIVRVNDRGPFHQNRIIDLSYSAAYKLDMLKTGTSNVTITAITNFTADDLDQLNENSAHLANPPENTTFPAELPTSPDNVIADIADINNDKNTVHIREPQKNHVKTATVLLTDTTNINQYIQVFASQSKDQASKLAQALSQQHKKNTQLEEKNGIFRVLVGPIEHTDELINTLLAIKEHGHPNAFIRK